MKLSIIIPAYNVEAFITPCIESILQEKYPHKEIIIINDGSTDQTKGLLDQLKQTYPQIHVIHQENMGLSAARNRGVEEASGDYITFVDSDDVVAVDMYQKMMKNASAENPDIVTIGVARLASDRVYPSVLHERFMKANKEDTTLFLTKELLYDTTAWNKIYRHTFWLEHKLAFPVGKTYEDIAVTMVAYVYARHVNVICDVGYFWRVRPSGNKSITQQKNNLKMVRDRLEAMQIVDAIFKEQNVPVELVKAKEYKYLMIDLFSMIEWLFLAPQKEQAIIRSLVVSYINAYIQPENLKMLPKAKRKMYHALMANRKVQFKLASYFYTLKKAAQKFSK
ncbi:glycosyltransferase [Listeria sp. PSOL-1]|uniref:glycosyltransferase n=1 Tax=Listeria sp. PSOL-1 TaxID=1844999 RepID=UPI0013D397F2|nr:glycosyltransferase [Listeria sp. PSOL-1]